MDTAIINAAGSSFGPIALIQGMEPADLTQRLEGLVEKFGKEMFKPAKMIKEGAYR
ncbi:MAG: hypothetical protein GY859_30705 [Desulfobacterales bacterium]|nr:hypothetical protein [Desulfobacterales bacterium]